MSRLIFPIVAILILLGMNTLFLWHTYRFFGNRIGPWFYVYSVLLSLIFPASIIFHNLSSNIFTKYFYAIGALWLGIVFLGIFVGLLYDIGFFFWKSQTPIKGYVWIGTMILLTAYGYYNQAAPIIKNIEIPVKNLENEIKIGYLSDVHVSGLHDLSYLDSIIEKLNGMDIDVVMINGDLVDGTSFERHGFKNLDNIKVPVFVTFGNHESYVGNEYALSLLKDTKARILHNEVVEFNGLQILGSEDIMGLDYDYNKGRLENVLSNMKWDRSKPSLLLLHEPVGPEISDKHGIDVQLAGHTHNGQIWPFTLLVKHYFPYMTGLYKVGNLSLYVSPGSGIWGPPMRIGSKSEITHITLTKE